MIRPRIPLNLLRRVEILERKQSKNICVALFPRRVPVDEWGALAAQMQAILKENIRKATPPEYSDSQVQQLCEYFDVDSF